jgi:hypothetical protein
MRDNLQAPIGHVLLGTASALEKNTWKHSWSYIERTVYVVWRMNSRRSVRKKIMYLKH